LGSGFHARPERPVSHQNNVHLLARRVEQSRGLDDGIEIVTFTKRSSVHSEEIVRADSKAPTHATVRLSSWLDFARVNPDWDRLDQRRRRTSYRRPNHVRI
jgi:hypothetical protein